jgi:hypothetical protein
VDRELNAGTSGFLGGGMGDNREVLILHAKIYMFRNGTITKEDCALIVNTPGIGEHKLESWSIKILDWRGQWQGKIWGSKFFLEFVSDLTLQFGTDAF